MPAPNEGGSSSSPSKEKDEKDAITVDSLTLEEQEKQKKDKKEEEKKENELSEEDKALKEGLELAVTRMQDEDESLHRPALEHLVNEIRSSTSSMTSVPKPLKFLRPHYETMKIVYNSWSSKHEMKLKLADVLSVLAMTMAEAGSRECLKYKLKGTKVELSAWGQEYLRSLSGEISEEFNQRVLETPADEDTDADDLMALVDDIVPFQMKHNAEAEAVDLLLEVQQLGKLVETPVVDEHNYERVCLYLLRSSDFMVDPEDLEELHSTAYTLYKTQKNYPNALRVALKMDSLDKVTELMTSDEVPELVKKQLALILGRHRSNFTPEDEYLNELVGNVHLSEHFLAIARDMDVLDPKSPEDIYKEHSSTSRGSRNLLVASQVDSARANLASSFVNGFTNAAYGNDKLMFDDENQWVFKNKEHGMASAVASLGMIMLWNVEEGMNQMDKYLNRTEDYIKAGACLGIGLMANGIRHDSDPALAILTEYIESPSHNVRLLSIMGLGIAYAGAQREELMEMFTPIVANTEGANIAEVSFAALALGMIYVGTCNDEVGGILVERLMESSDAELDDNVSRFLCLGLGLVYLGKTEKADAVLEAVRTVEHKAGKYAEITLESCAYAGTGSVLTVQKMLRLCAEHLTENAEHQAVAVLGIALTVIGEDVGTEMSLRSLDHLLQYGELPVKRVVPLALALMYISNPDYGVVDQLSRLSHDADHELAQGAILALGLISAGTNNSRIAGLLKQLSEFYAREANHLFVVRISQGLNSMGKGLIGLNPLHSDRLLMNGPALAGILSVLHASLTLQTTLLDKYHYLLYFLTTAMNTRVMSTVDTDLNPIATNVRVGQAIETVGQAGRPKTISGFQTHTTPVLLGNKERAELASTEWVSVASIIEGMVILEKAPEEDKMET